MKRSYVVDGSYLRRSTQSLNLDHLNDSLIEARTTIKAKVTRRIIIRKGFAHLLRHRRAARVRHSLLRGDRYRPSSISVRRCQGS
jgi:hypothetical protein